MGDTDDHRDAGLATVTRGARQRRTRALPVPARLRAVWPPELPWSTPLGTDPVVVGRIASALCTDALNHETVSRKHLNVHWDGRRGGHVVADQGSHNGSRVDGVEIGAEAVALADGALLQLGDVCVIYERSLALAPQTVEAGSAVDTDAIPGDSPAVLQLRAGLAKAARDRSPLLLLGETGVGKEWIAREAHRLSGRSGPIVAINCSALSEQIIDSQLFGHVKGAFTGASSDQPGVFRAAHGGTLFLDEIGEMPLALQPKLLRALQEGEVQPVGSTKTISVDVRVVAATNQRLAVRVEDGTFRRDLYARLALWELAVPPLRARRGDLLLWVERLYARWRQLRPELAAADVLRLSPEAAEAIVLYDWPNNLRELDRLVHTLAASYAGVPVAYAGLPGWLTAAEPSRPAGEPSAPCTPGKPPIPTEAAFVAAFEELEGNVRAMSKRFGRDRRQIYRWIEAYGLGDKRAKRTP